MRNHRLLGSSQPWHDSLKRLIVIVALAGVGPGCRCVVFVYPKYREYKQIADSFDLAELDRIPAISEVFDYAGMRYSRLEGEVRYVVPLAQISPNFIKALLAEGGLAVLQATMASIFRGSSGLRCAI